jgi:hypothetical protein
MVPTVRAAGSVSVAISHTAARSATATEAEATTQARSTGQGRSFHCASADRVSRQPWTRAKWEASIPL